MTEPEGGVSRVDMLDVQYDGGSLAEPGAHHRCPPHRPSHGHLERGLTWKDVSCHRHGHARSTKMARPASRQPHYYNGLPAVPAAILSRPLSPGLDGPV